MDQETKDQLLAQFQDITGEDPERCKFYLESSGWQLDLAMSSFYETGGEAGGAADAAAEVPMEEGVEPPPTSAASGSTGKDKNASSAAAAGRSSSNIATFSSRFGGENDSDSDEEQGQAFYAGGSDTSGQQILGPPKKKGEDLVKELFKRARESGAEQVDPGAPGSSRGGARGAGGAFSGSAFKLGSDSNDSEKVPASRPAKQAPPREFTLKMWSNGFSIDDGELRAYNDPKNKAFLSAVMTGRIPDELIKEARGGEVHVNMEDHKAEEYVRPKATARPFQGQGHMLGSVVPGVEGGASAVPAATSNPDEKADNEAKAKTAVKVDPSQPTTNIQIRLHDGSRMKVTLNEASTVADLRQYVVTARPELASVPFALRTSFPPAELEDDSKTLKDAGLLNAAVLLKPK